MSKQKAKYKLYIFSEGTKKWRLQGCYDLQKVITQTDYFESLSYKVQIRLSGKVQTLKELKQERHRLG